MPEYVIRPANVMDSINVTRLLKPWWAGEEEMLHVNEARAVRFVMSVIEREFSLVADLKGRIIGALACAPFAPPWSDQVIINTLWLHVKHSFREQARLYSELLEQLERSMSRSPLPLLVNAERMPAEAVETLAVRAGYTQWGLGTYLRQPAGIARTETSRLSVVSG